MRMTNQPRTWELQVPPGSDLRLVNDGQETREVIVNGQKFATLEPGGETQVRVHALVIRPLAHCRCGVRVFVAGVPTEACLNGHVECPGCGCPVPILWTPETEAVALLGSP